MKLVNKPLKDLKDSRHKTDYRSGGNFQTSYYKLLEEGGSRLPEVRISNPILTCEYLLSTPTVPFTIDIRTHNKLRESIQVTTSLGELSQTSNQLANESYTYVFVANSLDVANNGNITITFTGLDKFNETATYSVVTPYEKEADCYALTCESNSSNTSFIVSSNGVYALNVNGRVYAIQSLTELHQIAKDEDLDVKFYKKELL